MMMMMAIVHNRSDLKSDPYLASNFSSSVRICCRAATLRTDPPSQLMPTDNAIFNFIILIKSDCIKRLPLDRQHTMHCLADELFIKIKNCIVYQCVTVPKISNDTDTDTFFGTKFSDTGSETFFRYQILPIPVPILFFGTKFFRYRFRYHQKK